MKFKLRIPSLKKRFAAPTSVKLFVRHNLGIKPPRGWGWLTNLRKALYNRTIFGCLIPLLAFGGSILGIPSFAKLIP